jgi:hypothetical protein
LATENTVVVCGDFNARIGRQGGVPYQLSSPSVRDHAGRSGATLVDLMNTTGLYSLANRKAPRPDTRASALRGSR